MGKDEQSSGSYLKMSSGVSITPSNCMAIFEVQSASQPISGTIHFEGSIDGTTWDPLWIRSIYGGEPGQYIMLPGVYFADIQHVTNIRYLIDLKGAGSFRVQVKFVPHLILQTETRRSLKRYRPSPARLTPIIRSTGGREITDVTSDGVIYAFMGLSLYKSTDLGLTWTHISCSFTNGNVTRLRNLPTGELLIIGNDLDGIQGLQVWKSDAQETNFRKVANLKTVSDGNSMWGLEVYDHLILFAPYVSQPRISSQEVEAYISRDYGDTWECIFRAPAIDGWHLHGIKLDPFESRIWLVTGDGPNNLNTWFTDDWGKNWVSLWPEGEAPIQFTDLIALPNCLIFGLDDPKGRGFMRLDKPCYRVSAGDLRKQLHEAFFIDKIGAPAEATGRFVEKDGVAYLPYESPRGLLTATKDGYDYYVIWDYTKQPGGFVEGLSFFATTNIGKLVGYFKDEFAEGNPFLWIADEPAWIER